MIGTRRTERTLTERGWSSPGTRSAGLARNAFSTHVTKAALWALVACGPIGVVLAVGGRGGAVPPAPPTQTRSGTGPAGFAELYVMAYLAGRDLRPFFPTAEPTEPAKPGSLPAVRTVVTAVREVQPGYWSITFATETMRCFHVTVVATGDAASGAATGSVTGYVAMSLPAEVAGPRLVRAPELGYPTELSTKTPLGQAVERFLIAYLTGIAELGRYLSPGSTIDPLIPPPYKTAAVRSIRSARELPDGTPPADGTAVRVVVQVDAADAVGRSWSLTYALTLTTRAGRWGITAIDSAPALAAPREQP